MAEDNGRYGHDDEDDDDEGGGASVVQLPNPERDVDPAEWLSGGDVAEMSDFYYFRKGGRLKLAALTDREEHTVRVGSTKVNPKNPQGARQLDATKYRRNMIAASVNKASGKNVGDPGFVTPDALANRPVGELTQILEKVMEVSGNPIRSATTGTSVDESVDFLS